MPETRVPFPDGFGIVLPHDPKMQNRLILFFDGMFLAQPGEDYRFDMLSSEVVYCCKAKEGRTILTIIDPQDGRRWKMVYGGPWEMLV